MNTKKYKKTEKKNTINIYTRLLTSNTNPERLATKNDMRKAKEPTYTSLPATRGQASKVNKRENRV